MAGLNPGPIKPKGKTFISFLDIQQTSSYFHKKPHCCFGASWGKAFLPETDSTNEGGIIVSHPSPTCYLFK